MLNVRRVLQSQKSFYRSFCPVKIFNSESKPVKLSLTKSNHLTRAVMKSELLTLYSIKFSVLTKVPLLSFTEIAAADLQQQQENITRLIINKTHNRLSLYIHQANPERLGILIFRSERFKTLDDALTWTCQAKFTFMFMWVSTADINTPRDLVSGTSAVL